MNMRITCGNSPQDKESTNTAAINSPIASIRTQPKVLRVVLSYPISFEVRATITIIASYKCITPSASITKSKKYLGRKERARAQKATFGLFPKFALKISHAETIDGIGRSHRWFCPWPVLKHCWPEDGQSLNFSSWSPMVQR